MTGGAVVPVSDTGCDPTHALPFVPPASEGGVPP